MTATLPSLAGLSADASALLSLCARARVDERPGRHRAHQTTRPKAQPIIPIAKAQGVSRSEIVERSAWWGERLTLEQVTAIVDELVARGVLMRCVNGIRFSDAWGPLMAAMTGSDSQRTVNALTAAADAQRLGVRESAGMLHIATHALRVDYVPSHAPLRVDLVEELDRIAVVIAEMRAAVVAVGS